VRPLIHIEQLAYRYPDGKQALHGIDITVMAGEKIALVGANGAGKSTLAAAFERNSHRAGAHLHRWPGVEQANPGTDPGESWCGISEP
jgi:ABC-type transport system involved in cytochrome bd biosynthesis fused ATPase/permease subunit